MLFSILENVYLLLEQTVPLKEQNIAEVKHDLRQENTCLRIVMKRHLHTETLRMEEHYAGGITLKSLLYIT